MAEARSFTLWPAIAVAAMMTVGAFLVIAMVVTSATAHLLCDRFAADHHLGCHRQPDSHGGRMGDYISMGNRRHHCQLADSIFIIAFSLPQIWPDRRKARIPRHAPVRQA